MSETENLIPFDTTFCDLKTKVLFSDWGTIAAVRVMAFVQTREGEAIFSLRGIGHICHLSKSTVARTLELLVEKGFLLRKGDRYFANSRMEVSRERDSVPSTGQSVPESGKSVPLLGHNNQYNNQKNINTNFNNSKIRSSHPAYRVDNTVPWERPGFKGENLTPEQRKELLEKAGFQV